MEVRFRRADEEDLNDLLHLKTESWFGTHTITLANSITQKKWLEQLSENTHCPRNLILIGYYLGVNIGCFKLANIDWQNRKAEAGWDIYALLRGRGYGKKIVKDGVELCFTHLNLRRLSAEILVTNEASLKCAEYAGFKIEGVQKKTIFKNGEYVDNLLLGILRD